MAWIELTNANKTNKVHVNMDLIIAYFSVKYADETHRHTKMQTLGGGLFDVAETPEEVTAKIAEAANVS